MSIPLRVLLIEDIEADAALMVRQLEHGGYAVSGKRVETAMEFKEALENESWDIILSDYRLPSFKAPQVLSILNESKIDIPVIVVSGMIGEETAVDLMRNGARDYVSKNNLLRLGEIVKRELKEAQARKDHSKNAEIFRKSEARYRELFNSVSECVALYNSPDAGENFFFVDFNEAAECLENVKKADIIGKNVKEVFPGVEEFGLLSVLKKVWTTGLPAKFGPSLYKDKERMGYRESYIYRLPEGEVVTVYRDVTEEVKGREEAAFLLKSALEAGTLSAEVDLYDFITKKISFLDKNIIAIASSYDEPSNTMSIRSIAGLGTIARVIVDLIGKNIYSIKTNINELSKAQSLTGRLSKLSVSHYEFSRNSVTRPVYDLLEKMMEFEAIYSMGITNEGKLLGNVSVVMRKGSNSRILKVIEAFVLQVALVFQRKTFENQLKVSEEKYSKAFSESPDAIAISSVDEGVYSEVNKGFTTLFGFSKDETLGKSALSDLKIWKSKNARNEMIKELNKNEAVSGFETELVSKSGEVKSVVLSASFIEFQGQKHLLTIIRDVTGRKQLESQLIQAQKLDAVGQLASGVSHEFNNLLTVITLASEEAKRKNTPEFYAKMSDVIIKTSKQAASIARRLNEFSKKRTLTYKKQQVYELVDYVLELVNNQLSKKNVTVDKIYEFKEEIYIDDALLLQVILNVVQNAVHAVKAGGKISAKVTVKAGVIEISISDDGVGMDEETLSKIFDPFFTTKGAFGTGVEVGTGLGLSVSYSIMQSLKGQIRAESEAGKGSTFIIAFPALNKYNPAEMQITPVFRGVVVNGLKLLVADSDKKTHEVVKVIAGKKSALIYAVADREEAIKIIENEKIDLLITDPQISLSEPEELMKKAVEKNPLASVIIITDIEKENFGMLEERIKKYNINGVLFKPFEKSELESLIAKVEKERNVKKD